MNKYWLLLPPVAMVIGLWAMGCPWWCPCGEFTVWGAGEHHSQHLIDPWTWSHIFHGGFLYAFFRGFALKRSWQFSALLTLSTEAVWELAENTSLVIDKYRETGDRFYRGDVIPNSGVDMLACALGMFLLMLAFRLSTRKKE